MSPASAPRLRRLRRRLHVVLDGGPHHRASRAAHRILVALVIVSITSVILESVPELAARYRPIFDAVEAVALAAFSLEYLARLWCAPEHTPYSEKRPGAARLAFALSPSGLLDLATVLPAYASWFLADDLRIFLFLRLLRFLKLARYSPGMRSLIAVLEAERKALAASGLILFAAVLLSSAAMHAAEHAAQPDKFSSIPAAMWWAIVTITTVGYGDVTPVTLAGRIIASLTMVTGYVMLGLPVGIVATAFAEEIHRREFVVTWGMIASVPLFRRLDASAISEIMRCLRAQSAPAGTLIVRKGEAAHSMYFVAEGEVEVVLPDRPVRLGVGQFFGEIAIFQKTLRTANVRAVEPTKLLILDAYDLELITGRNPEIGAAIAEVARTRRGVAPAESDGGDIAQSELTGGRES